MLLRQATLASGRRVDVRVCTDTVDAVADTLAPADGESVVELAGHLLLPAPAEPHAHLDKALTADLAPNRTGDLLGAIDAWMTLLPTLTVDGIVRRGEEAARRLLANGCTTVRSHVNVGDALGLVAVEAMLEVRRRLAGLVDLELVALVSTPTAGEAGRSNAAALQDAMAAGIDVVGGCPHLDDDPHGCIDLCLALAGELGVALDLHMDETLSPAMLTLPYLCDRVAATGFTGRVTASHCCSLGVQDPAVQRAVAEECAATGVAVVALPQTNLFLQGRQHPVATPRGLTAVRPLLDAGAALCAGADNLQDPFNTMGRADPLETAALMVMAGHLLPEEAYTACSLTVRRTLGRPCAAGLDVAPGDPADLLAVPSTSLRAALADAPAGRLVLAGGRVVAGPPAR